MSQTAVSGWEKKPFLRGHNRVLLGSSAQITRLKYFKKNQFKKLTYATPHGPRSPRWRADRTCSSVESFRRTPNHPGRYARDPNRRCIRSTCHTECCHGTGRTCRSGRCILKQRHLKYGMGMCGQEFFFSWKTTKHEYLFEISLLQLIRIRNPIKYDSNCRYQLSYNNSSMFWNLLLTTRSTYACALHTQRQSLWVNDHTSSSSSSTGQMVVQQLSKTKNLCAATCCSHNVHVWIYMRMNAYKIEPSSKHHSSCIRNAIKCWDSIKNSLRNRDRSKTCICMR